MRCLLPRKLLDHGFYPQNTSNVKGNDVCSNRAYNYSWSGQRKIPSYLDQLIFPEKFLTALRTISMQEDELMQVSSLLTEVVPWNFWVHLNPCVEPPCCLVDTMLKK